MGWDLNYTQKAINHTSICKCTITITIRTLNIILRDLDLWTVLKTFMSKIGEGPSGSRWTSAFPPPLKHHSLQPRTGATYKPYQPCRFYHYLTLWKGKKVAVLDKWSLWNKKGGSVQSARGINEAKSCDVSRALRPYLWGCWIGCWRFLLQPCNASEEAAPDYWKKTVTKENCKLRQKDKGLFGIFLLLPPLGRTVDNV